MQEAVRALEADLRSQALDGALLFDFESGSWRKFSENLKIHDVSSICNYISTLINQKAVIRD